MTTVATDTALGRSRESMANSSSGVFEEEKIALGVLKSGTVIGGFIPFKGRSKCTSMYIVLSERALELFQNEKAYSKKKLPMHTIDLAIAFNVHNHHYDHRLNRCVCVMRPDDTLVFKAENEQANKEWFEAILSTTVPSRALRLGRFATPREFFEVAYDVNVVPTPKKLERLKGDEPPIANILDRNPALAGARRLCFYPHTMYICHKNLEPGKEEELPTSGIPPFKAQSCYEINRKYASNFGYRTNHFVMMLGRGSPTGTCEIWCEVECKQVAEQLHNFLNELIERDVRKRIDEGGPLTAPGMPNVPSMPRGHRNRSHTQPHRPRLPSEIMARNTNSPLAQLARKSSTGSTKGPIKLGDSSTPSASAASLLPGGRHSFAAPSTVKDKLMPLASVFPARRQSETIKEEASTYQPMDPTDEARKKEMERLMRGEMKGCRPVSPSTTRSSTDETEDSGGTLRCYGETEDSGGTLKMGVESRPHTPAGSIRNMSMTTLSQGIPPREGAPTLATRDAARETQQAAKLKQEKEKQAAAAAVQQQPPQQKKQLPMPVKSKADHLSSSEDDADADVISAGTNTSTGGESVSAGEDYAHMDVVNWNGEGSSLSVPLYKPRSFVSSSDSCYSSMAERQQRGEPVPAAGGPQDQQPQFRTYSFGPGHPSYQRPCDTTPLLKEAGLSSAERLAAKQAAAAQAAADGIAVADASADAAAAAAAKEDARKRAFSLGSKNFFAYCSRPFRKVSSRARQSGTSASDTTVVARTTVVPAGASLASSTISAAGGPPSSASSHHIASHSATGDAKADEYRNRSGSFGSGRSTPYSRRSGGPADAGDHLMELDFGTGGGGAYAVGGHHGLGRCGSGSMGSVDSPSRSRTSSFGCNLKRGIDDRDDHHHAENGGLTPSQILLAKAKQMSIEDTHIDDSDYVITEAPSMTSPRLQMTSAGSASAHHQHFHHHQPQHHSPEHGALPPAVQQNYPGGVLDVMGKSHDARSSQYFETIEETTSGRSSRASSIDEGVTTMAEVHRAHEEEEDEDEYAMMDLSCGEQQPAAAGDAPAATVAPATVAAPATTAVAAAPQQQLQPTTDNGRGSRSRSASPAAASARRADSASTLQSLASLSSSRSSDRENKGVKGGAGGGGEAAAGDGQPQAPPVRQKISTQSEGPEVTPGTLPKRASVPVLKEQEGSDAAAAAAGGPLNYAYLQLKNGLLPEATASPESSRVRSKSGIVFSGKEAAATEAPKQQQQHRTMLKPLP